MFRFGERIENQNIPEIKGNEGYRSIVPREFHAKAEIDNFWKKEFAAEHEAKQAEVMDVRDRLISEIYNRSEDEMHIDFDIDGSLQKVLDNFLPDKWSELPVKEKMDQVEDLVKEISARLDLKRIPDVTWNEEPEGTYGSFNHANYTMNIDPRYIGDSREVADTAAHELRHAYQAERAEIMESWEDALYRCNLSNYISTVPLPGGGCLYYFDYYKQYVEVDARAFANKVTEALA